ncbi:MAG: outer membrane lipoprotein carrier protein LolA [Bacilli bacterium]|nr:outer membrane lipoprotein carrier protein LolA [Bacilli bacterium]
MKKIFFIIVIFSLLFLTTGCGKYTEKSIVKDINKKFNNLTSYHIEGSMEIYNGEDVYKYDVKSSYENDNYRVSLKNKLNDHEQIILKNSDGIYVLTPSLNKSFKFQSNWPNNSSQVYILKSLQNDINEDKKIKLKEKNNGYILSTKLANTNNKNLNNQKIYLDKKLNITKVEVFDESGNKQIKMIYNSYDPKASFNNKYFTVSENMKSQNQNSEKSKTTSKLDESIYPMYLPSGTYLSDEESVSKEDGDRVILTFAGESPFILVEESVGKSDEMEVIPVYGDPTILSDTVGALSETSVNFISDGIEYYIASDSLTTQQIIQVAESISSIPVMK